MPLQPHEIIPLNLLSSRKIMMYLEGLNQIDWEAQNAPEAPEWIMGLASLDEAERSEAYFNLQNNFIHGEDQYFDTGHGISVILATEIPLLIAPFLIQLLNHDVVRDKEYILNILHNLANYIHFEYEGDIYHRRARQIRDAVWSGKEIYVSIAESGDISARLGALDLLIEFNVDDEHLLEYFIQMLTDEKIERIKVYLIRKLADLLVDEDGNADKSVERYIEFVQPLVLPTENLEMRIASALSLIQILKSDAPDIAIQLIIQMLISMGYYSASFMWGPTISQYAQSLVDLGQDKGVQAALKVIRIAPDLLASYAAVAALLSLTFDPQNQVKQYVFSTWIAYANGFNRFHIDSSDITFLTRNSLLSDLQKHALQVLIDTPSIWTVRSNLFKIYGLPNSRKEMSELLE